MHNFFHAFQSEFDLDILHISKQTFFQINWKLNSYDSYVLRRKVSGGEELET